MAEITVKASIDLLDEVLAFVDSQLEAVDCPMKTQMQIDIAVEEIFVNIARYAYTPGTGDAVILVDADALNRSVTVEFRDRGIPFNPLAKADPDITLAAEERQIGGLGIYMVKKSMDDVRYVYKDGQNVFMFTKKMP